MASGALSARMLSTLRLMPAEAAVERVHVLGQICALALERGGQIARQHGGDDGVLVAGIRSLEVAAALLKAEDEAVLLVPSAPAARISPPMYLKPVRTLRIFTP